jgi:hypothetical protein
MKHLKKSSILLMLLTVIICPRAFAQDYFTSLNPFNQLQDSVRVIPVVQDNEYTTTGYEQGNFYCNPLVLNGKPLNYNVFNIELKGELTVTKGAVATGKTTKVPFYVYLRRDGQKVLIPGNERPDVRQTKIEISKVLKHAKPDDLLVIEAVRKEDGPVKRILKVRPGGC